MSQANSEFEEVGFDDGLDMSLTAETTGESPYTQNTPPNYRKQGFSIYTVMLIMSFVFLITSIILLFIEVGRFNA